MDASYKAFVTELLPEFMMKFMVTIYNLWYQMFVNFSLIMTEWNNT